MNRNSLSLTHVSDVEITPEIIAEHMISARRLHDDAVAASVTRGISRIIRGISTLARLWPAIYHWLFQHTTESRTEPASPNR